ncbi:DUF917 domain-containing protein, partial [Candidatus Bathyarchaeota archaeon]|nr:DUF917 domain-containing protein [Candidatus Bathyarchaeota archaeon]
PQEVRDKVKSYYSAFPETKDSRVRRLQMSVRELSEYVGKNFYAYIASETGGGNGILPMYLNALEGKPSINADCCGRAKPEMGISLTNVAGIPVTPLVMVSPFMETIILKTSVDDYRAEDIARNVAVACGGSVTVARCPTKVDDYRRGVAVNQVTRCIKIGEVIRRAKETGKDPEEAFLEVSGALKVFEGVVSSFECEGKGGFNWGNWFVKGTGSYEGHGMRVWYKNEHLIGWIDGEPRITCPDLICIVDAEEFEGLSNFVESGVHNGRSVKIYGIKASDLWRTPRGVEIFGPRHFGFDIDYRLFEH